MNKVFRSSGTNDVFSCALLGLACLIVSVRIFICLYIRPISFFFVEDFSNVAVAVLMLAVVLLWLGGKAVRPQPIRMNGFELPMTLLVCAAAISVQYSADLAMSLRGALILIAEVMFFVMLVDLLDRPAKVMGLLAFLLILALLVSIRGLQDFGDMKSIALPRGSTYSFSHNELMYLLTTRRVTSYLGWPNTLAGYLMLFLPTVFALPIIFHQRWIRLTTGILALLFGACFLLTFSFLGWLSVLLGAIVTGIAFWQEADFRAWVRVHRAWIIIGAALFLGLFLIVIIKKNFLSAFWPRILYYKSALEMLREKPFLGHGWGTFAVVGRRFAHEQAGLTAYVHNSYLQVWVEAGLLGLGAIMLLLITFFRNFFNRIKSLPAGMSRTLFITVSCGLVMFFIDNLFSYTILKPDIAFHFWVMLAIFVALSGMPRQSSDRVFPRWKSAISIIALGIVLDLLLRMLSGAFLYSSGFRAMSMNRTVDAVTLYDAAGSIDSWNPYYPTEACEGVLQAYVLTNDGSLLKIAAGYCAEAIHRAPNFFLPYLSLGYITKASGDNEKARLLMREAKRLSPYEFGLNFDQSAPKGAITIDLKEDNLYKKANNFIP